MNKEYNYTVRLRKSQPRSKSARAAGEPAKNSANKTIVGGGGNVVEGHTHANKKDLDKLSTDDQGYLLIDGSKAKAGMADELAPAAAEKFLSAEKDDVAKGHITFENGTTHNKLSVFKEGAVTTDFVDSLTNGRGTCFTPSKVQTDRLEVRGSMSVMEMLINEIHAMAGDYHFSDCGHIDKVDFISATTYKLWMRKETDADITTLQGNDVLLSVVNNLLTGGKDYYSSWFRVAEKDDAANTITVVLYPDNEVPGGKNYPPLAGYNVTRKGNAVIPSTGINERSQSWMLSSREGRILFLTNVYRPILNDHNYALSLGKMPDLKPLRDIGVNGDIGLYAQTIACEKFYRIDWNGDVSVNMVDRGEWSRATATSDKPYRNITADKVYPDGDKYTQLEQHTVYHDGCKYACVIDGTTDEPGWNSQGWVLLEGDTSYIGKIDSDNGNLFLTSSADTVLTARVIRANKDITNEIMASPKTSVVWTRDTGNAAKDAAWHPTYVGGKKNVIAIKNADMGDGFGSEYTDVNFKCKFNVQ